jgi:hypothetical protein
MTGTCARGTDSVVVVVVGSRTVMDGPSIKPPRRNSTGDLSRLGATLGPVVTTVKIEDEDCRSE